MKWFFIYSIVAFVGLMTIAFLKNWFPQKKYVTVIITLASLIFHYFFLATFFYRIITDQFKRFWFLLIFILSIPIVGIAILQNFSDASGFESFSIVNFCLLVFSVLYFYQLLNSPPKSHLFAHASFWIVIGIFFSMGITIPLHSVFRYLKIELNHEALEGLRSIGYFAYGIMHLFFTKAYICSIAQKKVS